MSERVDKSWQSKGLDSYSLAAIFGTLNHYGAAVDEPAFRTLAEKQFPLEIAESWLPSWKGTGQFSGFPVAAAEALFRRLYPEKLLPSEYAIALVELMVALGRMREGAADAPVGEKFKVMQALKPRLPLEANRPSEPFLTEVLFHLDEWWEHFNRLAEELAKEGHLDDAEEFAELEEFLFPGRAGTCKAIVRAAKGEKEQAIADLESLAGNKDPEVQLSAVDGLIHLEAYAQAYRQALPLFDKAEGEGDLHAALEVAQRLEFVVDKLGPSAEHKKLLARIDAVEQAHHKAHPDHHP